MFQYYDWRIGACTAYSSRGLGFTSGFSRGRVARSLVFCIVFCRSLFVICPYSFGYCIACPSSIDDFWLPFWHIQTRIDNYVLADVYLKFSDISTPYIQNKQTKTMTLYVSKQTQIWYPRLYSNMCFALPN